MKIDLHIHTNLSDGILSVEETLSIYKKEGFSIVSITDHDTIAGDSSARNFCHLNGIEYITGVELTTFSRGEIPDISEYASVHFLGLGVDPLIISKEIDAVYQKRQQNLFTITEMLKADGFVLKESNFIKNGQIVDRGAIAKELVSCGYFKDKKEVFDELLNKDKYLSFCRFSNDMQATIDIIHSAGGLAIWAHPFDITHGRKISLQEYQIESALPHLISYGLDGLETFYLSYSEERKSYLHKLTLQYSLLESLGSDFHARSDNEYSTMQKCQDGYDISKLISSLRKNADTLRTHRLKEKR